MPPTPEHRFSKVVFDFYAPFIGAALRALPSHIAVKPADYNRSVETFSNRCRDAIQAKILHQYPSEHFSYNEFDKLHNNLVVAIHNDTVLIGSRKSIRAAKTSLVDPTSFSQASEGNEVQISTNPIFLRMLCEMITNLMFTPQPRFFVKTLDEDTRTTIMREFDITFVQDEIDKSKFYIL